MAAGAPAAHTSRVTLFFAGYGLGTVGRVRVGPVSGFSSGFLARQPLSFWAAEHAGGPVPCQRVAGEPRGVAHLHRPTHETLTLLSNFGYRVGDP